MSIISVLLPKDRYRTLDYGEVAYLPRSMKKKDLYIELERLVKYYYSKNLSIKDLEEISETDDVFGYAEKAKNALLNNIVIKHSDIMGDLNFYEGYYKEKDGSYVIQLGS